MYMSIHCIDPTLPKDFRGSVAPRVLLNLPIMKKHDQHVQVEVTPPRLFEDFATDVKKRLA